MIDSHFPKALDSDSTSVTALPSAMVVRLRDAGLRRTLATRAVLGLFLSRKGQGLSHTEVFSELRARGIDVDRVTLYRLLDRLAHHDVLQREVDEARAFRYWLAPDETSAETDAGSLAAPVFECRQCHQRLPLSLPPEAWQAWWQKAGASLRRKGHRPQELQLKVFGHCAKCQEAP